MCETKKLCKFAKALDKYNRMARAIFNTVYLSHMIFFARYNLELYRRAAVNLRFKKQLKY